jgi:CheY-like chemotaxis protein
MVSFSSTGTSKGDDTATEHVLVVDDDPTVLAMMSRILDEAGYVTTRASNGLDALQRIQDQPGAFNAVVSDILMPKLDGVALRERITRLRPSLPVVLLSGYSPPDLQGRGIEPPCAVVPKPVPPERLVAIVRDCIAGRRPSGS